jgi:hypothetical protein
MMGQISRRLISGLAVVIFATSAWSAEEPDLDVTFKPGWDNSYRPERWMPLSFIVVSKFKKPVAVRLSVFGQQDSMTNMTIDHDFVVTPEVPANVPMVTKLRHNFSNFDVSIQADKVRRVKWNSQIGGLSYSADNSISLDAIPVQDLLIGLCGAGQTGLLKLPEHLTIEGASENGRSRVHVKEKVLNLLPWDWTGYDCLDLLILHDPEWSQMNEVQARAIAAWINNGGKLLLVLGSHPLPRDHVLAKMLPFVIGPARDVALGQSQISNWEMQHAAKRSFTCWTLPAAKGWKTLTVNDNVPYFSRGLVGFGTVGVLAFAPSELLGTEPGGKFWCGILKEFDSRCSLSSSEGDTSSNSQAGYNRYEQYDLGDTIDSANAVLTHLQSIPEMRPLSIWWIISLLTVLALVLGPLDYFVLKRLDRLPLTWITSTSVIVLFSVGAYYGVEKIRGGLMQVRAVTVTDAVQGQPNSCWSTTMCGIFAPSSDSYRLAGPKGNQWWSALSPHRNKMEYSYSGDRQDAARNIYCSQQDGGNIPSALPINIWSMQCLQAETQSPASPLGAKVELGANRQVKVTLENRGDETLSDVFIRVPYSASDVCCMYFGGVPPHSTKEFNGQASPDSLSGWPWGIVEAFGTQGVSARTNAINQYYKQGAVVILARFTDAALPFSVENRKGNVDHIQFVRLVVPNVVPVAPKAGPALPADQY